MFKDILAFLELDFREALPITLYKETFPTILYATKLSLTRPIMYNDL